MIPGVKPTEIRGFSGINIRMDSVDLGESGDQGGARVIEMGRSTNTDKHTHPTTIRIRRGYEAQFDSPLADLVIRRLSKVNGVRYEVAGTNLYRNQTAVQDYRKLPLDSTRLHTTITGFKPLNDTNIWALIADRGTMQKDDGTNTYRWGLAVPDAPSVAQLNSGTYTYIIGITHLRVQGTTIAHESNTTEVTITESA